MHYRIEMEAQTHTETATTDRVNFSKLPKLL